MAAQPSLLGPHLTEGRLNYERRLALMLGDVGIRALFSETRIFKFKSRYQV